MDSHPQVHAPALGTQSAWLVTHMSAQLSTWENGGEVFVVDKLGDRGFQPTVSMGEQRAEPTSNEARLSVTTRMVMGCWKARVM